MSCEAIIISYSRYRQVKQKQLKRDEPRIKRIYPSKYYEVKVDDL